jgi:hypothetical protein
LRGVGRGHSDDKGIFAFAAPTHVLQHVAALFFGQIDVKNDKGRTGGSGVGVGPIEKSHSLISVIDDMERKSQFGCPDRFLNQEYVGFVVFDYEQMAASAARPFIRRGG